MDNYCYFYLGSKFSAHFSYLSHNVAAAVSIKRYSKNFWGIIHLIFSLIHSSICGKIVISSSPVIVFLYRILFGVVIFDCHGNSKFLILLKYVKPNYAISNSRGTHILLRHINIKSRSWLPCPSITSCDNYDYNSFDFQCLRQNSLNVLVAGHLGNEFLDRFRSFRDASGSSIQFKIFHFGRLAIADDNLNYVFMGYKSESEIAEFCKSNDIRFGLVFYPETHHQKLFMSPLKCDFYDRIGLSIFVPNYLNVIKYNKYQAPVFTYDNDGVIFKSNHLKLIARAPDIYSRLGVVK